MNKSLCLVLAALLGLAVQTPAADILKLVGPGYAHVPAQSSYYDINTYPASLALDGNYNNFTHTAVSDPLNFWQVDLLGFVPISHVVLFNRVGCCPERLSDITLTFYDANTNLLLTSPVLNPGNVLNGPASIGYTNAVPQSSRLVRVTRNDGVGNVLSLGEVEVYATNLASGRIATQVPDNATYPAANGVNGNLADFTHTANNSTTPYWQVDLGMNYAIDSVNMHNRDGCCGGRLRDITVSVLNSNQVAIFSSPLLNRSNLLGGGYANYGSGPEVLRADIRSLAGGTVSGRFVRITRTASSNGGTDDNQVLALGEVQVFGVDAKPTASGPVFATSLNSATVLATVGFSEPVTAATATNITNYVFTGGPTVLAAALSSGSNSVVLSIAGLPMNTGYSLTISNVSDLVGNVMVTTNFTGNSGFYEVNAARSGTASQSSMDNGGLPNRAIDGNTDGNWGNGSVTHSANSSTEVPRYWEVDLGAEQLLGRLSTWFRTDCCWDRNTNFTLLVLAADRTTNWSRTYPGQPPNSVTYTLPTPIPGRYVRFEPGTLLGTPFSLAEVQAFLAYTNVTLVVTQSPSSVTVLVNHATSLLAGAALTGAPTSKMFIQWQSNGVDIANATNANYTTPFLTMSDDGAHYQVVFGIPGLVVTSAVATITINNDTVPPSVIAPPAFAATSVLRMTVFFSELLVPATATNLANYVFTNGAVVADAVLFSNQTVQLTLTNLPQNSDYLLTISGVSDLAGNLIVPTNFTGNIGFYELNVALGGTATQSSTGYGGVASRAIDGNTSGIFGSGTITHSAEPSSEVPRYWEVDLGAVKDISRLSVWFRTECCWDRNTNFTLLVLAADRSELLRTNYPGTSYPPTSTVFDLAAPVSGRFVRFEPGSTLGLPFSLSEVQAIQPYSNVVLTLTQSPASVTNTPGHSITFSVGYSVGGGPMDKVHVQWQRGGVDIPGANAITYTTPTLSAGDDGVQYSAVVSIPGTVLTSSPATVSLRQFVVNAWYRMGEEGVGANNRPLDSSGWNYHFQSDSNGAAVQVRGSGAAPGSSSYYVFNGANQGFTVTGFDAPEDNVGVEAWVQAHDLSQLGRQIFGTGGNTEGITLLYHGGLASAIGNVVGIGPNYIPSSTNEWVHVAVVRDSGTTTFYVNGAARSSSTATPYNATITRMAVNNDGITFFKGAVDEARIFIFTPGTFNVTNLLAGQGPPLLTGQSPSQNYLLGSTVTLQAAAVGAQPIYYQWVKDGTNVLADQTNATLTLANLGLAEAGSYTAVITNSVGSTNTTAIVLKALIWNAARLGTASQSTTDSGYVASRALDGNTDGTLANGSVTLTATPALDNEWWEVDLGALTYVDRVHLWFRTDCCQDRAENLRIVVYDSADPGTRQVIYSQDVGTAPGSNKAFDVIPPVLGRVVRIEHPSGVTNFVSLAEVQVYEGVHGQNLLWVGVMDGLWDVTNTFNWDPGTYDPTVFSPRDNVTFDDGSSETTVNLAGALGPTVVTVNADQDYTFTGGGEFSGYSLIKTGGGTLTLANDGTNRLLSAVISQGALQIGQGGTVGTLLCSALTNNATLILNRSDDFTVSTVLRGSGVVRKEAANTVTVSSANTYTGGTIVSAGTLKLLNNAALGEVGAITTVSNGATLDIAAQLLWNYTNATVINGFGVATNVGALTRSLANGYAGWNDIRSLTLGSDASIGGVANSRIDIGRGDWTDGTPIGIIHLDGQGHTLSLVGGIYFGILAGAQNLPAVIVGNGTTIAPHNDNSLASATVTLNGGTLTPYGANHIFANPLVLNSGFINNQAFMNTYTGPVQVNGPVEVNTISGGNITFAGNISGAGSLTKIGAYSLFLSGDNSGFSGAFTNNQINTFFGSDASGSASAAWVLNNGVLANSTAGTVTINLGALAGTNGLFGNNVAGSAVTYSIGALGANTSFSGNIVDSVGGGGTTAIIKTGAGTQILSGINSYTGGTIVQNGTLQYDGTLSSANGAFTVSGGTLAGTGTLNRPVTVQAGGTLAPGASIGTLTINHTLSLAGHALMEIDKTGGVRTSDHVQGVSTLTYGGTLTVTNSGEALVSGDSFTLFTASSYSGSFTTLSLPTLEAGLAWDTSRLTIDGTIRVADLYPVSGQVALEGYVGLAPENVGTRSVTFVATADGGAPAGTWTLSLNFTNGVAPYTLPSVLGTVTNLSAKTAWNLRQRLPVAFSGGSATVDFAGPNLLRAGDLDDSNSVGLPDYYALVALWYQTAPAGNTADLDGNGVVDADDYFLLANRWDETGDPQ